MHSPKIIILRGNSGSGKSTVAKALQEKIGRGTLMISQDYVRREMLWVNDRPNNQAIDLLENLIVYGHKNCNISILEGIFYSDIYENLFCLVKTLYADNIFAYYFDLPFEETLKRHEQKQKNKKHDFGETEMKKWWREKDLLTHIHEKIITKDMELFNIINRIKDDLQK
jgi:predicted kinase